VRIAASSKGLGKNALAAWLSWWSVNANVPRKPLPNSPLIRLGRRAFSLSHTGSAMLKLEYPDGAYDRYVSISRSNLRSGFS